ncbi:MAG TPA: hypothetical protein VJN94_13725 [Candidatus Binataceae bacterium]|nr:hypothetical protein [Candidatus Binataceae bacterium]
MVRALIVGAIVLLSAAVVARRVLRPLRVPHARNLATAPEELTPTDQRALTDTIRQRER